MSEKFQYVKLREGVTLPDIIKSAEWAPADKWYASDDVDVYMHPSFMWVVVKQKSTGSYIMIPQAAVAHLFYNCEIKELGLSELPETVVEKQKYSTPEVFVDSPDKAVLDLDPSKIPVSGVAQVKRGPGRPAKVAK